MKTQYMTELLLQALDEIIDSGALNGKKIVLFGLNPPAFLCKQRLEERGLPTFAYVDNSPSAIQWWYHPRVAPAHHCFRGQERIPACKPDELPGEFHEEYVFLLYSKFEREMLQQLEKLGYSRERQTFVVGGFWKTEERKRAVIPEGAGTPLTQEEIKARQMEGLRYIHNLCEKHHLKYYLHYGTLLGAVRHRGYIPWDDDLDLLMMNDEMLELMELIRQENGRYGVFYAKYDDLCRHFIAKIEDRETLYHQWDVPLELFGGMIALDIFPMAGLPPISSEREDFYYDVVCRAKEYDDLIIDFPNPNDAVRKQRGACKQYVLDAMLKYDPRKAEELFTIPIKPRRPLTFYRKCWDERILLPFEGESFYAPAGYEEILTSHYGDYLTLPPESKRVSNHRTRVFQKRESSLLQ